MWCVRTLTQIVSHFEEMSDAAHLHQYAWQWFITGSATDRTAGKKSTTGLDTLMRSLAKHQDLKFPLITLMDAVSVRKKTFVEDIRGSVVWIFSFFLF